MKSTGRPEIYKGKRVTVLNIKVEMDLRDALVAKASSDGESMSSLVRKWAKEYLEGKRS